MRARQLSTRARVLLRGAALDRELAAGVDPQASAELRCRARQLDRPHRRRPVPLQPRGLAIVEGLLTESSSPLFAPGWRTGEVEFGDLRRRSRTALAVFEGRLTGAAGEEPRRRLHLVS